MTQPQDPPAGRLRRRAGAAQGAPGQGRRGPDRGGRLLHRCRGAAAGRARRHGRRPGLTLAGRWDVVVIGGGNAGLAAALTAGRLAGQSGGRVLLLDRGPAALRGGNTRHTRNIRCAHGWSDAYSPGTYLVGELWRDLCGVGTGPGNEQLAELTVRESESVPAWMTGHGVHWQPPLAGTLHLGRTNRFFL